MISSSLLDDKQRNELEQIIRHSHETFDPNSTPPGIAVFQKSGKYSHKLFDNNLPVLIEDEEVLWHRIKNEGVFNKKIWAFEALTNFRAYFYDFKNHQALPYGFVGDEDVVVNNQKRYSASNRTGNFAGIGARGTFAGSSGGVSYGESQTIGDVVIMADGHADFTFYQVEDPSGLSRLVKHVIKSTSENFKKYDEQRGSKKEHDVTISKNMINCEKCGTLNPKESKYCNKCGMKFNIPCTKCGKVNPSGSSFCNECGFALQ